jgi:hypothetical protein
MKKHLLFLFLILAMIEFANGAIKQNPFIGTNIKERTLLDNFTDVSQMQTADSMFIKLKPGGELYYRLDSIDILTFSGEQGKDTFNVKLLSGSKVPYPISQLDLIRFSSEQTDDSIFIELKTGKARKYAIASISTLSFIGWDKTTATETPTMVSSYALDQNYPNPFNTSTTIQYYLPGEEFVNLTVTGALGQGAIHIVHEQQSQGLHSVVWDASGFGGGIYFYRLQAGKFLETKCMILLK